MYGYNTSSAYRTDFNYIDEKREKEKKEFNMKKREERIRAAKRQQLALQRAANTIRVLVVFAVAFVIINRYVAINEANSRINELKKTYNEQLATNQNLQAKIDKSIDLKKLQTVASEKFGMVRPEQYQIFYVDMGMDDYSENVAENAAENAKEKVAVNGVPGTIIGENIQIEILQRLFKRQPLRDGKRSARGHSKKRQ